METQTQITPNDDLCPSCDGRDGHHFMACEFLASDGVDDVDLGIDDGLPTRDLDCGLMSKQSAERTDESFADKIGIPEERRAGIDAETARMAAEIALPPTADDIASVELLWLVAKTCHEVNRAFCREILADHSHLPWDESPAWQRQSCYDGVVKHFENPEMTPEDSHQSWCDYKTAEGWVHGNRKDEAAKTHPSLLPYHMLHAHDRAKDHLFAAVCKSMFGG